MKKLTLVLLAGAALAIPGAALAQNNMMQNQPPQSQMQQPQSQMQQPQNTQQMQQQPNQQASNQPISPQQIGRSNVRQVQQNLNKSGFNVGRPDGVWGPRTSSAVRNFQKSKNIQSNGQLDRQTLSDLGVNVASIQTPDNSNNNNNNNSSSPNQNQ